jgi:hypothetical protein
MGDGGEMILPVMCNGYCLISPKYIDNNQIISLPYSTDDIAKGEGWTVSTNRKFSIDGKAVAWLCPDCSRQWQQERQVRIDEVMSLAIENMTERQYWNLVTELQNLDATIDERNKFSGLLFSTRTNE